MGNLFPLGNALVSPQGAQTLGLSSGPVEHLLAGTFVLIRGGFSPRAGCLLCAVTAKLDTKYRTDPSRLDRQPNTQVS